MIGRLGRMLVATFIITAFLGAGELVHPRNAFACSCRQTTVADFVGQRDSVIVSGRISNLNPDNANQVGTFTVTRLYQGLLVPQAMPIRGGGGGDCTIDLRGFVDAIFVATIDDDGTLAPFLCAPFGDLSTPEGQAVLAEVNRVFGAKPVEASLPQGFDPVQLAIIIVTPFVAIVLILAVVAVFRRRDGGAEAS